MTVKKFFLYSLLSLFYFTSCSKDNDPVKATNYTQRVTSFKQAGVSELILGLQPYMNVVRIGEKTGGKDTGIHLLQPYILDHEEVVLDPVIGNWALLPVVSKYHNKEGDSVTGGLQPDYEVKNSYLLKPALGNPQIKKNIIKS